MEEKGEKKWRSIRGFKKPGSSEVTQNLSLDRDRPIRGGMHVALQYSCQNISNSRDLNSKFELMWVI